MRKRKSFKKGPTAHGATGQARVVDYGREWPEMGIVIPASGNKECHFYRLEDIRALSEWLCKAADHIEKELKL